jgi:hypothetical protein
MGDPQVRWLQRPELVSLVGALVGAAIAAVSSLVTTGLQNRDRAVERRFNEQVAAYSAFAGSVLAFDGATDQTPFGDGPGLPDELSPDAMASLQAAVGDMESSLGRVALTAPQETFTVANETLQTAVDFVRATELVVEGQLTQQEAGPAVQALEADVSASFQAFVDAARDDLGTEGDVFGPSD